MSLHESIRPADVAEANTLFKQAKKTFETASFADAFILYQEAAALGHAHATYMVGKSYLYGHGVKPDEHHAMRYLQQAIQLGVVRASYVLAHHFRKLEMFKVAFRYYLMAANGGDSEAQIYVGDFYEKGISVKPDLTKAIHWYTLAGNNQNAEGKYRAQQLTRQR